MSTHRSDSSPVDDSKGAVTDQVFAPVLVVPYCLHHDADKYNHKEITTVTLVTFPTFSYEMGGGGFTTLSATGLLCNFLLSEVLSLFGCFCVSSTTTL